MSEIKHSCVDCGSRHCGEQIGSYPPFCPTTEADPELLEEVKQLYLNDPTIRNITMAAAEVEGKYYCRYTRVQEVIAFARRMGAKKLGIATCGATLNEARTFAKILRVNDFEVVSVQCKAGALPKSEIGIEDQYIKRPEERVCNPILQAKILNKAGTDLNILLGLCVGHDSLFYKYSEAPVTTLFVKDRVTCHNPVAPLYLVDMYYKKLLEKQCDE